MKKINLMIAAGLLCAASVQAQTTIASVGFEPGDSKYTTEHAYTPGGTFGNWVNKQDADTWTEPYTKLVHSGSNSLLMENSDSYAGNSWDRGFMVGNLKLTPNTSYRVSFWVRADGSYYDADTGNDLPTHIKSSLSIGREYCDMAICIANGTRYEYNFTGFDGEWRHISYLTYFIDKDTQDEYCYNYTGLEDPDGNVAWPRGEPFPDDYFVIINCYNPGSYILDDIKVEAGVTFNEASFSANGIRLDFGYATNIADLAKAGEGEVLSLPTSCVAVKVNGKDVPAAYVEGQKDGYLYIFFDDDVILEEEDQITVSFTPAADCPIIYTSPKRPSADVESEMKVLGFTNETAYYNGSIDALPSVYGAPKVVKSVPENESFELDPNTLKSIDVTYDKELSLDYASATLYLNGVTRDYTENMTLSADKKTISVALPTKLSDNEYTMILSGVANSYGVEAVEPTNIIFAIGKDKDNTQSEVVYQSDFDNDLTDGVPPGWNTYNEAGYHLYGFNDEDRTSQYTYNYGGNPGGGGTRLYAGFTGDFNKAMYWGSRGTPEGYAEYGSLVKDYIQEDGTLSEDTPEDIVQTALILEPRKYNISFLMAAWKGEPTFTFTLEDLEGNVYAKFEDYLAAPNVNGQNGANVTGSVKCEADFTVDKAGYYVLRFTAAPATWQEYLLANVKLITMPSKASYWKSELAKEVEKVQPILDSADGSDYDGETKTAFAAAIAKANAGGFTSGTQISKLIEEIEALSVKMQARVENIDTYSTAVLEAQIAVEELPEKYQNADLVAEAKEIIKKYENVDAKTLSDEELAEVAPALTSAMNKVKNAQESIDYLTYGVNEAAETAEAFGADVSEAYDVTTDDRALADKYNKLSTLALYKKIAAKEDLSDLMIKIYDLNKVDDNAEEGDENFDAEGHPLVAKGIEFTGMIVNPNFYTTATTETPDFTGWTFEALSKTDGEGNVTTGSARMTATASAEKPVNIASLNAYGASSEYKFYQTIENLPVGIYTVYLGSRTAVKNQADAEGNYGVFNAQNEDGIWDKYIYAQVGNATAQMTPFATGGNNGVGFATTVTNVTVKEGEQLTIGAVENYTSGKASGHNWDANAGQYEPADFWDTNTYVRDAMIFFVAPLEGYDYAKAARDLEAEIETAIETVKVAPAKASKGIFNMAGQKVDASYKGIVIIDGVKVLRK